MKLKYENKTECHDFTLDLNDAFLDEGKVFLDPFVVTNGFINILKKTRIIRDITGISSYNYVDVPIAKINMGKLREFDKLGVKKYLENKEGKVSIED